MKRLTAVLLSLIMLLSFAGCGDTADIPEGVLSGTVDEKVAIIEGNSSMDKTLLYNPDRGWRMELYYKVPSEATKSDKDAGVPAQRIKTYMNMYAEYTPQLSQLYVYLSNYCTSATIDQYGLDCIQRFFDEVRNAGIKVNLRFAYLEDMTSGKNEATDEIMLAHMKQLKPLVEKNKDVIHVVEAGFIGAWGEWHSDKLDHDRTAILKGVLDMTPEDIYVQVRHPDYKNLIDKDNPDYARIGIHNDAFFGDTGTKRVEAAGNLAPGYDEWNQGIAEAAYAPAGGELFWGNQCPYEIDGYEAIKQFSKFRQTSFSIHHSFIEDGAGKGYSMEKWLEQPITKEWCLENGVNFAPGWFLDDGGNTIERNVFEFVRDHFGYKLEADYFLLKGDLKAGNKVTVGIDIINYGMSAAFNMESGFAILDKDGNVVTAIKAGDPEKWYSRNPENYYEPDQLSYEITTQMKLPEKSGTYRLAFYVKNSANTFARLGSRLDIVNGYHILTELYVD